MGRENPKYACKNSAKRKHFTPKVKERLEQEAIHPRNSRVQCMYPGCDRWHVYEFHHIRPVWAEGDCSPDNGILLCPDHHAEADRGLITPLELFSYKNRIFEKTRIITDRNQIESLINSAMVEAEAGEGDPLLRFQKNLVLLRNCDPHGSLVSEVRRAIAKVRAEMGGHLTSRLNAIVGRGAFSERYQVELLARGAAAEARKLEDWNTLLHANHVLAVNANAIGQFRLAAKRANTCLRVFDSIPSPNAIYAAYLTRNLPVIFSKAGIPDGAKELICRSKKWSCDEGETSLRNAERLILAGHIARSETQIGIYHNQIERGSHAPSTAQKVIGLRIQAIHLCLRGSRSNIGKGLLLLDDAITLAKENDLGHQLGKLTYAIRYFDSSRFHTFMEQDGLKAIRRGCIPRGLLKSI